MTTAELLIPRVKVKVKYPKSRYKAGQILIREYALNEYKMPVMIYHDGTYTHCLLESEVTECPEIFEQIPWYADRKVEDMPEYVKVVDEEDLLHGQVVKVLSWKRTYGHVCKIEHEHYDFIPVETNIEPATEQDYITFKQSQKL